MWLRTVAFEIMSVSAISAVVEPSQRRSKTSHSLLVSGERTPPTTIERRRGA
jgi:hypothetical protein